MSKQRTIYKILDSDWRSIKKEAKESGLQIGAYLVYCHKRIIEPDIVKEKEPEKVVLPKKSKVGPLKPLIGPGWRRHNPRKSETKWPLQSFGKKPRVG